MIPTDQLEVLGCAILSGSSIPQTPHLSDPNVVSTSSAETDATLGWTLSTGWSSGIRSEVQTFSGAGLPTAFGGSNTTSTGIVRTDLDANRTLVTDQASKQRISKTNALGQLTDVYEIMASSDASTSSVAFPNTSIAYGYVTSYVYDTLNNLTTVNQGSQTRTFAYSSLSRLTSATNPESGTISYVYDNNGNLTSKVDARSITTSYTYDVLNRVTDRDYSDSTPDVDYFYGTTAPKVGKLTKVASSVSTTEYTSFDILGRVTGHKQTTDGVDYTTGYTYKLSGSLDEQTYPSGRVAKNELDVSGDLASVTSKENSSAIFKTYVNDFAYNAAGAVTSLKLGNGKFESTTLSSRLQPTQIALGHSETDTSLLKLVYGYGTTANNGNVLSQDITVKRPGTSDLVFNQTYTYDELNRLKVAEEKTGSTTNWKQTFTFDRYGNRRFDEANTTMPTSFANGNLTNPTFNSSNNRMASGQIWTYDSAGNVTVDPDGRTFTYDGENKQTEVKNSSSVNLGIYFFDGDGKRVKKVVPSTGETTVFVYDAGAKLIGEYSTIVQNSTNAKVQYLTQDNLGTPRINTDAIGSVTSRSDYLPYGEELTTQGGRSSSENYQGDDVRQGFTGYEHDVESGLEYAQARMYAYGLGRFSTTDPVLIEPNRAYDPQRINLYVYVRNSPLVLVDSTGQIIDDSSLENNEKYQKWKAALLATEAGRNMWNKFHDDKKFRLTINLDPDRDNGAVTQGRVFENGKLVAATISLGPDIGDRSDAAGRPSDQYPLSSAAGIEMIDSNVLGAAVIAHEFGHVEDAQERPEAWQAYDEYRSALEKRTGELGTHSAAYTDSNVSAKRDKAFGLFGVKDIDALSIQSDNRAERTAIPVIEQSFGNKGKSVPKRIQKAIDKLTGRNL